MMPTIYVNYDTKNNYDNAIIMIFSTESIIISVQRGVSPSDLGCRKSKVHAHPH